MLAKRVRLLIVLLVSGLILGCAVMARPAQQLPAGDKIATSAAATLSAGEKPLDTPPAEVAKLTVILPTSTPTAPAEATQSAPPALLPEFGLTIAYVDAGRNLWAVQPGSAPRQLTHSGDVDQVKVSADAAWIAFLRTADNLHYSLWVIRNDGSEERVVMDEAALAALPRPADAVSVVPAAFGWVPGHHQLAFTTRPTFEGPGLATNDDLWIADIEGGTYAQIFPAGSGGKFIFSADGAQVALVRPTTISLANSDGSHRRDAIFTYPAVVTYSEYQYYADPRWSADASFLEVVIPPAAALERPEDPAVAWRIPVDGTPAVSLGSFTTAPLIFPMLAPDLAKIAYLSVVGDPAQNRRELHLVAPDGSGDEVYQTGDYLSFLAWAPWSNRFVFSIGEDARLFIGAPGEPPQAVGDWRSASQVRWVDDSRFLFVARSDANVELRLWTAGGEDMIIAGFAVEALPYFHYDFGG